MDRSKATGPTYQYQAWPAYYYGPDGQSEIFQSEDEVPEGWEDHPSKVGKDASKSSSATEEAGADLADDNETVQLLINNKTAEQLVQILEDGEEEDDSVEFLKSWPKMKLAKAIVAYDLVPEDLEEEDD